jgi:hypothetical protein
VLVVPDGTRAWFVTGRDAASLVRRAKDLVTPGARSLADRSDLTAWLAGPSAGGMMITVEGAAILSSDGASSYGLRSAASSFAALASVPRGGHTPLLVSLTRAARGDGPSAKVHLVVPFAVIDEARQWQDKGSSSP